MSEMMPPIFGLIVTSLRGTIVPDATVACSMFPMTGEMVLKMTGGFCDL